MMVIIIAIIIAAFLIGGLIEWAKDAYKKAREPDNNTAIIVALIGLIGALLYSCS